MSGPEPLTRGRLATLYGAGLAETPGVTMPDDRWTVRRVLAVMFLFAALPTCLLLALLTPLGQVADEQSHLLRAASLTHGQWIGRRAPAQWLDGSTRVFAGVDADQALLGVQDGPSRPKLTAERIAEVLAQPWAGRLEFYQVPNVAIYMPAFYVPAALGLAAARCAGAGPFVATYAARLANAACFAALGLAALLLARRGHAVLFCTLTLPMTLSLAASVNQDGLIIGTCALAAALLTRSPAVADGAAGLPRGRSFWIAALLLACVAAVKPPYGTLLLGLLLPLPPVRAWPRLRRPLLLRLGAVVLLLVPGLLWGWLALGTVATPYGQFPYEAGPLWPGPRPAVFDRTDAAAQLTVLLAEPLRFLTLPWNTIVHDRALLRSAVGVLGWLNLVLPGPLYALWYAAVPAALLCDLLARRSDARRGGLADLALGLAAAASGLLAIYLSQYLAWTPVGHPEVLGPSGRYLLPILPIVAISLPALALPGGRALRAGLAVVPAVAATAGLAVLPPVIVYTYVLR